MKLTTPQLGEIKTHVEDMGIKYLDVQMEIVDHTACKIEENMEKFPEWSFDTAFYETRKDFGYLEYKAFEKSFEKSLFNQKRRISKNAIKEWFIKEKLGYTILLFSFLLLLFKTFGPVKTSFVFSVIQLILCLGISGLQFTNYIKMKKLLTMRYFDLIPSMWIMYWWNKSIIYMDNTWPWSMAFAAIGVCCLLFIYGSHMAFLYSLRKAKNFIAINSLRTQQ